MGKISEHVSASEIISRAGSDIALGIFAFGIQYILLSNLDVVRQTGQWPWVLIFFGIPCALADLHLLREVLVIPRAILQALTKSGRGGV